MSESSGLEFKSGPATPTLTKNVKDIWDLLVTIPDLKKDGFGSDVVTAFTVAAQSLQSIISSRTPGGAALTLIEEMYDLKGFFIKSKSCDWGPMAGFVCMLPCFNKAGVAKYVYNTNYMQAYLDTLRIDGPKNGYNAEPFLPLRISNNRVDELQKVDPRLIVVALDKDRKVGFAFDKDKTVVMSFLLMRVMTTFTDKDGQRTTLPDVVNAWDVLCGSVCINQEIRQPGSDKQHPGPLYPSIQQKLSNNCWRVDTTVWPFKVQEPKEAAQIAFERLVGKSDPMTPEDKNALASALATEWPKFKQSAGITWLPDTYDTSKPFVPVFGVGNPFAHITKDNTRDWRDTVTGDYDLFAVWPRKPADTIRQPPTITDMMRVSEQPLPAKGWALLDPVAGKPLTRRPRFNSNLLIEFVPDDLREDPALGNISFAVASAAMLFNSAVYGALMAKLTEGEKPFYPDKNKAFHSDEGGRPFITEIEFPSVFFHPDMTISKVRNEKEFQILISFAMQNSIVPIQAVWLAVLMFGAENGSSNPKVVPAAPAAVMQLILGPPRTSQRFVGDFYTPAQVSAYNQLKNALGAALGDFNPDKREFARTIGTTQELQQLFSTIDEIVTL